MYRNCNAWEIKYPIECCMYQKFRAVLLVQFNQFEEQILAKKLVLGRHFDRKTNFKNKGCIYDRKVDVRNHNHYQLALPDERCNISQNGNFFKFKD